MKKNNRTKRFFEIIPGALTWATLISLFVCAIIRPVWVAIFVITFDLYWVIRVSYLTALLVFAYRRLARDRQVNWLHRCRALSTRYGAGIDTVYQAILFPVYKEGLDILIPSCAALKKANYPKERMIVVVTVEERAGEEAWDNARKLQEQFRRDFGEFLITRHPDGIPGELRTKGANATWGAKMLKEFVDTKKIPYEQVIISCFDADTCADPEYFGCLTYHYSVHPKRTQASYQPIPVYNNNIWHARSIARVIEMSSSFCQLIESMRIEKFVTFSSHSMSFKTLIDVDYWPVDMISDDSVIYWKCFLHFDGDYAVVPLYVTVSMDTATEPGILATIAKQYKQKRRWAWGVENFPYVMMGFLKHPKIPLSQKIRRGFHLLEGHYTWAVWAIIVSFVAPLPLILGGWLFQQTAIGYNLPSVTAALFRISLVTIGVCILVSFRLLPPRPPDVKPVKGIAMYTQWLFVPFVVAFLGSTPAIDAQTRLMLGSYMHFQVTSKSRHKPS